MDAGAEGEEKEKKNAVPTDIQRPAQNILVAVEMTVQNKS